MNYGLLVLYIFLGILALFLLISYSCLIVIHQAEGVILERLGKFNRVLESGIHFIVPLIDRPRQFTWRKTYISEDGKIVDKT